MNYLDIIIVIPLVWFAIRGFKKGVIIEAASLLALLLGIWGALKFSGMVSGFLIDSFSFNTEYTSIVAFAITFILIVIAVHFMARLVNKLAKAVALGPVVKILGALFGMLKVLIIVSVLLQILDRVNLQSELIPQETRESSLLYNPLKEVTGKIYPSLRDFDFSKLEKLSDDVLQLSTSDDN